MMNDDMKMRIAFLAPHLRISGGTRILLQYASLLASRGHVVRVFVKSKNPIRRTLANMFGLGRPVWIDGFCADVVRVSDFSSAKIGDHDIVVATTWKTAEETALLPKNAGGKFFLLQHDEGLYHGNRERVDATYKLPLKKIVVSSWIRDILKEKHGESSALLINPFDRTVFYPLEKEPHDEVRILLLDHTYEWKGTKEGVAIVNELKKKYPNIRLLGFGVRRENTATDFDEYYFNLPQEKLAWLYSRADIFLCPSWDEGFGLPSVEAMACQTAVVTYDNGGSRDFAFDGKTALVAERRNILQLKAKLEGVVANADKRKEISEAGFAFVKTLPTWTEQTTKLEKIFEQAVRKI